MVRLRCGIEKLWDDRLEEVTAHAPGCGVQVFVARRSVGNVGERRHVLGPTAHVIVDEQNVENGKDGSAVFLSSCAPDEPR